MDLSTLKKMAELAHHLECLKAALRDHDQGTAAIQMCEPRCPRMVTEKGREEAKNESLKGFNIIIGGKGRNVSVLVPEDQIWQSRSLRGIAVEAYLREIHSIEDQLRAAGVEIEPEAGAA